MDTTAAMALRGVRSRERETNRLALNQTGALPVIAPMQVRSRSLISRSIRTTLNQLTYLAAEA